MALSLNHVHPWIFVGPVLLALAACPQKDPPGTTDDPETDDTTSDVSMSTSTAASTSSGSPSTPTGETTASPEPDATSTSPTSTSPEPDATSTSPEPDATSTSPEPDATSTSTSSTSTSTTTLDPDTTTGGDPCAVDLAISLALDFDKCDGELVLVATVHNVGTVDAPPGLIVSFYKGADADGQKLATLPTTEPLSSGGSTDVVLVVAAGPASDYFVEVSDIVECDESNNGALVTDAACP
jgi:hypothetical protein